MKSNTRTLLLLIGFLLTVTANAELQRKKTEHRKTVVFEVSMTCENCKRTIEKNIAFEKGVKDMKVNLAQKRVILTFDTRKTDEQKLIEAFEKLGYKVKINEANLPES